MNQPESNIIESAASPKSRREFLKAAALTGAAMATGLAPAARAAQGKAGAWKMPAPRSITADRIKKVRLAFIATDGMGNAHIDWCLKHAADDIICPCYCDVDTSRQKPAGKAFPDAKAYQDYREMFEKEHKNFDAVMIATPDHHHFPATMLAFEHGKHVYTQKPLAHTPWEARWIRDRAAQVPVATQMGNQGHASEGWRILYEWIHSGAIGDVTEVHTWTDRPIWPQGMNRPEQTADVPPELDWGVWLGPAPERPYAPNVYHRFNWRGWWDFGAGSLGDMGCHNMDGMFWAMQPGYPLSVEPVAQTLPTAEAYPNSSIVKWEFGPRNGMPAFTAYWYDNGLLPTLPPELEEGRKLPKNGSLFIGSKAAVMISGSYGQSPRIIPETKMREVGKPPKMLERSPGHYEEWIMACKGEKPIDFPKSRFAYSAPMTESVLLGCVAQRVGRRLEIDGPGLRVTNLPEVNELLTKEYREGWDMRA